MTPARFNFTRDVAEAHDPEKLARAYGLVMGAAGEKSVR